MYQAREMLGRPVVTYDTGERLWDVKDVIIALESPPRVLGFLVNEAGWNSAAEIVPLGAVQAIGPDVIIVPSRAAVKRADAVPEYKRHAGDETTLKGMQLITTEGQKLGGISDFRFTLDGRVEGFEVSGGVLSDVYSGRAFIPADTIAKVGQGIVFVPPEAARIVESTDGGVKGAIESGTSAAQDAADKARVKANEVAADWRERAAEAGAAVRDRVRTTDWRGGVERARSEAEATWSRTRPAAESTADDLRIAANDAWDTLRAKYDELTQAGMRKYEEERIKRAVGRPVNRVVLDQNDRVILDVGDIITFAAIDRARQAGVLDILLGSVYMADPKFTKEEIKAASPRE